MNLADKSDKELKAIALLKNKKGCYTSEALRAQRILYARGWHDVGGHRPDNCPYGSNETEW